MMAKNRTATRGSSGRLQHTVRLDAVCAHGECPGAPVHVRTHGLQVGKPAPARPVVCVTDIVAADRFLAANFTHFCHCSSLEKVSE
jgi:hypothetical protein